jgi:hypothetical protein
MAEQKKQWFFHDEQTPVNAAPGVVRRVLAYNDGLMCVENRFETGAEGALHHHPAHADHLCGLRAV